MKLSGTYLVVEYGTPSPRNPRCWNELDGMKGVDADRARGEGVSIDFSFFLKSNLDCFEFIFKNKSAVVYIRWKRTLYWRAELRAWMAKISKRLTPWDAVFRYM